jgi:hypothetical protein
VTGPRVVAGIVRTLTGETVEVEVGRDPDTADPLTVTAEVPALAVGSVAWVIVGPHGAVVIPSPGGASAPTVIEFRTYAELRDGITVPRPPARED